MLFDSMLRQDISWYDTTSGCNFITKITEDIDKIREGIGEKFVIFIYLAMTFITSVATSFVYGWKLTLVVLSCCPFIILSTALATRIQGSLTDKELSAYSTANDAAEEVFKGIRTVVAFSGESKECQRYNKLLEPAENCGKQRGLFSGIGAGFMWFVIYVSYAIAIAYGVKLILKDRDKEDRDYTPAVVMIVLFGIIIGAQNLGFASHHLESFAVAGAAGQSVFTVIDRISLIDPMDRKGLKPINISWSVEFKNIHFRYPSRPEVNVLKNLNLSVPAGKTVAFVGPSGCGKSTCLQLLQRLYEPESGSIQLDGRDIRDLNIGWLRSNIGVVGQEPVLFTTTIEQNIRYGNLSATHKDIEKACRIAHCHHFISDLPSGYSTVISSKGDLISGGQKQRIAIARALVRNPKILLLDEATSALDSNSERKVQEALENASKGRTTLVIAHKLSTITNADKIVYFQDGQVMEEGTHEELMKKKGYYFNLYNSAPNIKEKNKKLLIKYRSAMTLMSEGPTEIIQDDEDDFEKDPQLKEKYKVSLKRVADLNKPEWKYILIGCIAAALHGCTFSLWAIFFGEFYGVLSHPDAEYVTQQSTFVVMAFLFIGMIAGFGTMIQNYMFNVAGVKLTNRLRHMTFKTIISQEIAFFDDENNSVGALCARLAGDCSNIQGATGSRIGILVQSLSTLVIGIVLSFVLSWTLTLVTLIGIPVVVASVLIENRYMKLGARRERAAIELACNMAVESINNIRTVNSLGIEEYALTRFIKHIVTATNMSKSMVRFRGIVFGLSQSSPMIAYGISLFYGGFLVASGKLDYKYVVIVSEALLFGSWMLGQAMAYSPNVGTAMISAGRIMKLFDRVPSISPLPEKPYKADTNLNGNIMYKDVSFAYPDREDFVLQGIDLTITKGTTVALVGPSGCGKSTCLQLLLRFYDPIFGSVRLNGIPVTDIPLNTLRYQIGLVAQEPILFNRTIAENIAYGDNARENIPMSEIIDVAIKSNIHEFILTLPLGYNTLLGGRSTQLSGGQKQRIAIARALIRQPKILVLDEATSALDMYSEKIVQDALDEARKGITCITIAHKLTTIRDSNLIYVLSRGEVAEQGTHADLMKLNGIYAKLYLMQIPD